MTAGGGGKIGYVISGSTPTEFLATLHPEGVVPLYEYVAVDSVEIPPSSGEPEQVKLIGQIVKIYRDPYQVKRDIPLFSVVESLSRDLLEVQIAKVKVVGYLWGDEIHMPKLPSRIGAPVYLALDDEVQALYGRGDLCVGRLSARPLEICLDLEGIKRHLAVIAATGAGKTWFSVVLIEELLKRGAQIVVLDPHGEYVPAAASANSLGRRGLVVKVSEHHPGDVMYKIGVVDTDPDALADAAGIPAKATKMRYAIYLAHSLAKRAYKEAGRRVGPQDLAALMAAALEGEGRLRALLKRWGVGEAETAGDLAELAKRDRHSVFSAAAYLKRLRRLGVFSSRTTALSKIMADLTVVNLAGASDEVQDYVAWHLLTRIFKARVRHVRGLPGVRLEKPIVVVVEEAHRFAPPKAVKRTRAYEAVSRIAAEGRKFGAYLVVITQRPSRVDPDVMSQMQSQVIMRIINPVDQEAVRSASEQLAQEYLDNLPGLDVGEAIVLGPVARLPAVIRVRDRVLEYGGADISLADAWKTKDQKEEVILYWRRFFGSAPPISVALEARRLSVKHAHNDGGVWQVAVVDGAAEAAVEFSLTQGYARCSCGMRECPHIYKALEEVLGRPSKTADKKPA
ncbi:MAG: ATP-binding protein [Thermoproteus sp.]|nr:ATP-binding protein [Thermoproteus sp.]